MFLFCRHKWQENSRNFTPPVNRTVRGTSEEENCRALDSFTSMALLYGFTNIEFVCEKCNYKKYETLIGNQLHIHLRNK